MTPAEPKSKPILFSATMVRAILEGRKTQTRRIVKPQPKQKAVGIPMYSDDWIWSRYPHDGHQFTVSNSRSGPEGIANECPYGHPGDRLWVRETFYDDNPDGSHVAGDNLYYLADARGVGSPCCQLIPECSCAEVGKPKWRPSIHMPRWASRITLEITGVRVERLQEISEADAESEGVSPAWCCSDSIMSGSPDAWTRFRESFQSLWNSIHGPDAWAANPFVWCIAFRRL